MRKRSWILIMISMLLIFITACNKENMEPEALVEQEIKIAIENAELSGTLLEADNEKALAIIVPGSGPTDRNGNSAVGLNTDAYKKLDMGLKENGISSFRYDKRGVGQSKAGFEGKEAESDYDDVINDLVKIIEHFEGKNIWLIGHSEGSTVSIIAAQKTEVQKVISLAGPGENIADIINWQIRENKANPPEIIEACDKIIEKLKNGEMVDEIPDYLMALFRPSVQPYLISWMKYEPAEEIAKLKCEVVVIQGDADIQVTIANAEKLGEASGVTPKILKGMNHVLVEVDGQQEQVESYSHPELPLHPELINSIVE
ncbi:MAG: alpha/beta hydrolase [Tissierellia bacterium]|nr:alpha/beta hydrolase [Tissierellia bacterium]